MAANNTTHNSSLVEFYEMHPAFIAFQCVFFIVLGFFGVFGNCIALVALATTPKLRNTCTALIGNLSVADLFSSIELLFLMTPTLLNRGFPENMVLCKVMLYLPITSYSVSLTSLMFITVNRYLLITRPRTCYNTCCGTRQVAVHITVIWLISFFMVILPAISGTRPAVYDPENRGCIANTNWLFTTITLLFYVVVPAFVLVPLLYGLTICAVKASHKRVHARTNAANDPSAAAHQPPTPPQNDSVVSTVSNPANNGHQDDTTRHPRYISKREINLTRLPILIIAVFSLCWTPELIHHICSRFMKVSVYYMKVASLCIWANSAINPYLYAWSNRNFRQAYKKILNNIKSSCKIRA